MGNAHSDNKGHFMNDITYQDKTSILENLRNKKRTFSIPAVRLKSGLLVSLLILNANKVKCLSGNSFRKISTNIIK